jgi:hypothetical protein
MSGPEARERLGQQQAALVRALTGRGEAPPGFVEGQVETAARSLASKRRQEVARAWPALAACLGEKFVERFDRFAAETPLPAEGGPLADGRALARALRAEELSDEARAEVFWVDLRWRSVPAGLVPRRVVVMRAVWLRQKRRLLLGMRLLGATWALAVPLP